MGKGFSEAACTPPIKFFLEVTYLPLPWQHGNMNKYKQTFKISFLYLYKIYNLGQNEMELLSPFPFGIIEMGEGVVQMFHLFCPRL